MFEIYVDFDGTITNLDSIVAVTDQFGAGRNFRYEVVQKIERGEIDVFECIRQELLTITVPWEEALEFLQETIEVDPGFPPFVDWCNRKGYAVSVVSSGIEAVIRFFLKDLKGLSIFAHDVEFRSEGWIYRKRPANDKSVILENGTPGRRVFIGDGLSDIGAVPHADFLFAKRRLEVYCRREQIPYFRFQRFPDVQTRLEEIAWSLLSEAGLEQA